MLYHSLQRRKIPWLSSFYPIISIKASEILFLVLFILAFELSSRSSFRNEKRIKPLFPFLCSFWSSKGTQKSKLWISYFKSSCSAPSQYFSDHQNSSQSVWVPGSNNHFLVFQFFFSDLFLFILEKPRSFLLWSLHSLIRGCEGFIEDPKLQSFFHTALKRFPSKYLLQEYQRTVAHLN